MFKRVLYIGFGIGGAMVLVALIMFTVAGWRFMFGAPAPAQKVVQAETATPVPPTATATPKLVPPLAPSDLKAIAKDNDVVLNWKDNSNDEIGFEVVRSVGGKERSTIVAANTTHYTDSDIECENIYNYRVRAKSSSGLYSGYSNSLIVASSLCPTPTPVPPTATPVPPTATTTPVPVVTREVIEFGEGYEEPTVTPTPEPNVAPATSTGFAPAPRNGDDTSTTWLLVIGGILFLIGGIILIITTTLLLNLSSREEKKEPRLEPPARGKDEEEPEAEADDEEIEEEPRLKMTGRQRTPLRLTGQRHATTPLDVRKDVAEEDTEDEGPELEFEPPKPTVEPAPADYEDDERDFLEVVAEEAAPPTEAVAEPDWLREMAEAKEETPAEEAPDEEAFDLGRVLDEIALEELDEPIQCQARTKKGHQCTRPARTGFHTCAQHSAQEPDFDEVEYDLE